MRIEGRPLGLLANDCRVLGGAIDADAAEKAARFLRLCSNHGVAVLSLCDTPGFMVGPDSEKQAAVRHMSDLFVAGAQLQVPLVTVFLRKAYGLGAMAMAGGGFAEPVFAAAWPTGEFGGMGLEGAVRLGYRKELEAESDPQRREQMFSSLLAELYKKGRAVEAATHLEIDAVIDPADTRRLVSQAFGAAAA
jgi:acetyl-CoA carboxylase carboxyltransferase component